MLENRMASALSGLADLREQVARLTAEGPSEEQIATALSEFDGVWQSLSPRKQARILGLLVEQVEYDAASGAVSMRFHAAGLRTLAEVLPKPEETAA